jgi:nicotinate-nucleotide adenylyltransferase
MALVFEHRTDQSPARVAVFPGAWNPPTIAHLEIARAALRIADEVVWILPRVFPHKTFDGATFDDRRAMLRGLAKSETKFSAAVSDTNLHFQIAAEARATYGPQTEISLVCGRDAVERIATWDYGSPGVFEKMLVEHPILVASRKGEYLPDPGFLDRIIPLDLPQSFDDVSSTDIRERIGQGKEWRHLVPAAIADRIEAAYRTA